jgi:hypothetical protein
VISTSIYQRYPASSWIKLISCLAGGLLVLATLVAEELSPGKSKEISFKSNNNADSERCAMQLNLIQNALQEYQKQKHAYPRWLSDLVPDYLHDEKVLACPFVRGTGNVRNWRKRYEAVPVFGDPKDTSYGYELCTVIIPALATTSCREYKLEQMEILGWGVPVVRCLAHVQPLNLALDGTVYQSGEDWEDLFIKNKTDEKTLQAGILKGESKYAVRELLRPRPLAVPGNCLDLSNYFNGTLFHLSQMQYQAKPIEFITNSVQSIDGISYEIRGLVHLTSKDFPIPFPDALNGIGIYKKCARIHILHGAMGETLPGKSIASYVFRTEKGGAHSVPIVYGKDVKTRWFEADDPTESKESKPVWVSPPDLLSPFGKSLRLYVKTWENPEPEVKIQSIDFVSEMTTSAPFIVAITTE